MYIVIFKKSPSQAPPENIRRLEVLLDSKNGLLRSKEIQPYILWKEKSSRAPISDILRVHEWSYVCIIIYLMYIIFTIIYISVQNNIMYIIYIYINLFKGSYATIKM
jgi:hypothetical protein